MSDKEMLFYAKAYRTLTKATAEISNNSEDQKRFEIIDWLVKQAEKTEKYREALEFYADESIYSARNKERAEITFDYGEKARQALEG
jgi:membrane-anchored protein YejM (alkaline phosphatase superfamily)